MLKKIFKAAKKAAPIIGAGLGFLYGGPMLGSALGGGLGSLVAGKSPKDALKFAALSGLAGGALGKFGGIQGGQGLGGLFGRTAATSTAVPSSVLNAASGGNKLLLKDAIMKGAVQKPGVLGSVLNFAKANPLATAGTIAGLTGLLASQEEEDKESNIKDVYGTVPGFANIGDASVGGVNVVPFSQYGPGLMGKAMGGQINGLKTLGLRQGGFPRKNGKIAGPGTETSDDIPAMLSDGEFVINSRTVRGLGQAMGGKGKQDTRDRGSKFLYSLQNKYGGKR